MGENEIIGTVQVRLRSNSVSDVKIKKFLEEKQLHGCKTDIALVKKALLYYMEATSKTEKLGNKERKTTETAVYDSLFG